jgi:2-phosphosulfolactate phosphatase
VPDIAHVEVDVALVPAAARRDDPAVFVVVDEIRASTTLATLLEIGCPTIHVEGSLVSARRRARETSSLLVGERHLRRPPGFDYANSPTVLRRADLGGREVVLSTTNGTAILGQLGGHRHVLVGCLRNARACAAAAVRLAIAERTDIRIVCAGRLRRFVLEDAVAAGAIVTRILETVPPPRVSLDATDAARAAMSLVTAYPDTLAALEASDGGRTLHAIGEAEDLPYCAELDMTDVVPALVADRGDLRVVRLDTGPDVRRA